MPFVFAVLSARAIAATGQPWRDSAHRVRLSGDSGGRLNRVRAILGISAGEWALKGR
jgi:hypothetical protein